MSAPEDRLRQILLAEAEDLIPAGDGLRIIEQRLADRRSLRSKLVPAVAIAGVVLVAGAAAVTVSLTDDGSLKQPPAHGHASPAPTSCTNGLCEEPKPSPSLSTSGVTTSASGTPVWPFTTDAQAADWEADPGSRAWAGDPVQVTQHLLDDVLSLPGHATTQVGDDPDAAVVEVSNGSRPVSQVRLVRVGRDANGPWSVTGAVSDNLSVTQPNDGDSVASPIHIAGTASDPDTSVHVRLISGRVLGENHVMAGRDLPWTDSLTFTASDWSVAALVADTFSGKGDLSAITLTAVNRKGAASPGLPAAGAQFVAVDQQHRVVTVDAVTGTQLRQLSFPQNGAIDSSPDRGGQDGVVWVRTQADGCTSSVIRVGLVHGPAGVTVDPKPIRRTLPSLSEGGRSLAWVEQPCTGGASTVVVRGPDAKFSTTAASRDAVRELDVRDDGYAVVQTDRGIFLVAPGSSDITTGRRIQVAGCTVAAPAWDGVDVLVWQLCDSKWSLGRWTTAGTQTSLTAVVNMSAPRHTAVDDGQLLMSFDDGRIARLLSPDVATLPGAGQWSQPDW